MYILKIGECSNPLIPIHVRTSQDWIIVWKQAREEGIQTEIVKGSGSQSKIETRGEREQTKC